MRFNYLIHDLPDFVVVEEREYKVNSDFRTILSAREIEKEQNFYTPNEIMWFALGIFYKDEIPNNVQLAYEEYLRFINCYSEQSSSEGTNEGGVEAFDYSIDSSEIYSAFFQIYHIDLFEVENLHWFKFVSLMSNLNDGTPQIVNLMKIRTTKIDSSMSNSQKVQLMKLKKQYSLDKEDLKKHNSNLANTFLGGMKER